jgi:hypothetical protein
MTKRQSLILFGFVIIAIAQVVKVNDVTHHLQLFTDPRIFWSWMSGAATTVVAFLLKSDGHSAPTVSASSDAPTEPLQG